MVVVGEEHQNHSNKSLFKDEKDDWAAWSGECDHEGEQQLDKEEERGPDDTITRKDKMNSLNNHRQSYDDGGGDDDDDDDDDKSQQEILISVSDDTVSRSNTTSKCDDDNTGNDDDNGSSKATTAANNDAEITDETMRMYREAFINLSGELKQVKDKLVERNDKVILLSQKLHREKRTNKELRRQLVDLRESYSFESQYSELKTELHRKERMYQSVVKELHEEKKKNMLQNLNNISDGVACSSSSNLQSI